MSNRTHSPHHPLFRRQHPGSYFVIPFRTTPGGVSPLASRIYIRLGRDPTGGLARTVTQRRLWRRTPRRLLLGTAGNLQYAFDGLNGHNEDALDALLCYTRGEQSAEACEHCLFQGGVFRRCVVLDGSFRNRCANCIIRGCLDCTFTARFGPQGDAGHMPDPEDGVEVRPSSPPGADSREQQRRPLRAASYTVQRGRGTASDPYDLTGDD